MTTPEQNLEDFDLAVQGLNDLSPFEVLHAIIEDVLDSLKLACQTFDPQGVLGAVPEIYQTVEDYVVNNYGEAS